MGQCRTQGGVIALLPLIYLVGEEGFEPTRDVIPADFKSASSAGSDTRPPQPIVHRFARQFK